MESVDKLRDWAAHIGENPHLGTLTAIGVRGLAAIADCIERETAELAAQRDRCREEIIEQETRIARMMGAMASRYVELPLDADGVPIRVGDSVYYDRDGARDGAPETVKWIAIGETETHITTEWFAYDRADSLRHVGASTVEDAADGELRKTKGVGE